MNEKGSAAKVAKYLSVESIRKRIASDYRNVPYPEVQRSDDLEALLAAYDKLVTCQLSER